MKVLNLSLKNFRNIEEIDLEFSPKKNLIIGKNAQGKTNILESIYLLSTLKSQRTYNNSDFVKFDTDGFLISADVEKNTKISLEISYKNNRALKVNNLKTNPREFKSVLKTVLFSSQDLMLLRGAPEDRRNWLDCAIMQIYPIYGDRLSKYNKIRIQKNNLLKNYDGNRTLLEVYNEQLAITGTNIICLRKKFLKEIEAITKEKHKIISGCENLTIRYGCNFLEDEDTETEIIFEKFRKKQEERYELELIKKQTISGPHKDDVIFYLNEKEATKFASQGQQRTIVLSLKLAELDIIANKIGENPVLLLDDVLAELDDLRQNYLLKTINSDIQTIITSVDTLLFDEEFLKTVKIFKIEDGKLIQ
ncbi:MAG: DNA replication/repair protein RecF [Candidatus Melainabacteria bacterium]|nr:MAG: DNA replication/repair protein RecF [Candidatus Melainabacteria bacterium]